MELMPGYKYSDVGVIPDDWAVLPLGKLVRSVEYGSAAKSDVKGAVPVLRMGNLQGGKIDWSDLVYTDDVDEINKYTLQPGDVLFNRTNTIDLVGKTSIYEGGCPAIFAGYLIRINVVPDLLDSRFLNYILNTEFSRKYSAKVLSVAVGQANINGQKLKTYPIPLPPTKTEQEDIAQALNDADELLVVLDQMIAKKRDLKQATMQQLLTGETRLPGFSGNWEVMHLGEVAHIKTGSRNNEDKVEDGQYPFFVRSEFVERINSYSHDCEAILVPGEGRIGDIFHYINGRFDVHQRVYAITKFSPGISGRFVYFYLSKNFGAWAMQNTVKATVDSLRLPTFQTFEMRLPPTFDEQIAIANALSDIDGELCSLENRRDKINNIKQAMMQELLTGKTRLV